MPECFHEDFPSALVGLVCVEIIFHDGVDFPLGLGSADRPERVRHAPHYTPYWQHANSDQGSKMDWNEIRESLVDVGLPDPWATLYAKSLGRCTYCHHDLLVHRPGYGAAEQDHLLPIDGVGDDYNNLVLACRSCNLIKGAHCVLQEGEVPEKMLENCRRELIGRARNYVTRRRIEEYDPPPPPPPPPTWNAVKQVILGTVQDWDNQPADE